MQRPPNRTETRPGAPRPLVLALVLVLGVGVLGTGGVAGYGADTGAAAPAAEANAAAAEDDAAAAEPVGASTGVYTDDQRELGAAVFARACAGCHGAEAGGGVGPPLDGLIRWWEDRPVGALFRFVSTNMPMDRPGTLAPEEYAAVLAHVLAVNGYPAGDAELPHDADVLDGIVFDAPPGG